ncbi:flagellar protein FliS [Dongia rigui]|uniref:Flagellar protein FliS n=1 Tax=Dongia rigui TaxID=940149 RepID=A0ABU5DVG5_9PROT|nr:flagellar protein FliS [Dongia rigui]MDY0870693.1 flagellar protein FliS [Dongia rigui]
MKQGSGVATRAYRSVHAGSSILDIVISVYDAAIIDLLRAKDARLGGRLDQELAALNQASHRVLGLRNALDSRLESKLVGHLARFYLTASFQMLAVPRRKDPIVAVERLIRQIRQMRDAWRDVAARAAVAAQVAIPPAGEAVPRDWNVIL